MHCSAAQQLHACLHSHYSVFAPLKDHSTHVLNLLEATSAERSYVVKGWKTNVFIQTQLVFSVRETNS